MIITGANFVIFRLILPRAGEVVIDKINYVEDTKGNNGVTGIVCVHSTLFRQNRIIFLIR